MTEQGEEQFLSVPPSQLLCTQSCAHVKDPIFNCRKRVDLTAGGIWKHENAAHTVLHHNVFDLALRLGTFRLDLITFLSHCKIAKHRIFGLFSPGKLSSIVHDVSEASR